MITAPWSHNSERALTQQRYNPVVVDNYCRNADYFLSYLAERKIALEAVTPTDVSNYLRLAVQRFCEAPRPRSRALLGVHSKGRNPRIVAARAETLAT